MLKEYYYLTKPGIIRGNVMIAAATFVFASQGSFDLGLFIALIVGSSLIIASSCVFNNYLDISLDAQMARTKKRALVTGNISKTNAIFFAIILGAMGLLVLGLFTNVLALLIGLVGMFFYVVVYGYYKRNSVHGTIIGSISGALPPVAGYAAVTNNLDLAALLLFMCLVFWQMPHFYAIAMYRLKEYEAAKIPVLPAIQGIRTTKLQMNAYIFGFLVCCLALGATGSTGVSFIAIMSFTTIYWLYLGIKGLKLTDNEVWARSMFKVSLVVLLSFAAMLSLNNWLI